MAEWEVDWWDIDDLEEREAAEKVQREQGNVLYKIEDQQKYRYAYRRRREIFDYQHKKHRRRIDSGKFCSKCGGEIGDQVFRYEPLYRGTTVRSTPTNNVDPICENCAPDWLPELSDRVYTIPMNTHMSPCESCGREVFFVSQSDELSDRLRVFCCGDCKADATTLLRHKPMHEMECDQCGETFKAKRSDAKYCSDMCRMRAYRLRQKGTHAAATEDDK
jgi:hypothetical protein